MSVRHNAAQVAEALARVPQSVITEMDGELARGSAEITREARENAPKDSSALTNSIAPRRVTLLEHHITAASDHASFREYGSGPGGRPSLDRMMAWIRRKGITPRAATDSRGLAFLIARKIAREGTPGQPYMEPAYHAVAPKLDARLRASVARGIASVTPGHAL